MTELTTILSHDDITEMHDMLDAIEYAEAKARRP